MDSGKEKEILAFQLQRNVSMLCKNFLIILEDLQEEYDRYFLENTKGIKLIAPPEEFLSDKHFDHLRKRILDRGGEITRDLLQELDKYEVNL